MAKKELIDRGSTKGHILRTDTGRFVSKTRGKSPASTHLKESKKGGSYRSAVTGSFTGTKIAKSQGSYTVRHAYSMPNGDKIVTVRRDIVDYALGRKK